MSRRGESMIELECAIRDDKGHIKKLSENDN